MNKRIMALAATATMLLDATVSVAQSDLGQGYFQLGQSMMSTGMMNNVIANNARQHEKLYGGRSKAGHTSLRAPGTIPSTNFTYDPKITEKVKRNFVAFLRRSVGPKAADSMQTYLAHSDFRKDWAKSEASDGLKPDNTGDALAAYWVLNWMIANKVPQTTRAQVQAVERQVVPAILNNPQFTRLNSAGRQEIAEVWQINYIAQSGGFGAAMKSGDAAMIQAGSDAAETRFQNEAHVDLRSLKITDQGFVRIARGG